MIKLNLSSAELKTIHNTDFFAVKASAAKKIDHLLAEARDEIKKVIEKNKFAFPDGVDASTGKIFRGENYSGLPYLVLDYPKYFSKESVFAFRTMFWWGNFFSCTMHLQGRALEEHRGLLIHDLNSLKNKNIYVCVNSDPWQYHYQKSNYLPVDKLSGPELKKLLCEKEFLKFSRKIPIKDYKKLAQFAAESFLYLYPAKR